MRLALGMITKDLLTTEPIDQFIENAKKFNHPIDSVIVAYSDVVDQEVVEVLEKDVKVHLVNICQDKILEKQLNELGVENTVPLIGDATCAHQRTAYGLCRNHVIIKAILEKLDILVFIDTDVYPEVIVHKKDLREDSRLSIRESGIKDIYIQEVDFLGTHLNYLNDPQISVTTSDYSGYYIIPPMQFQGMQDLFYGLKKEGAYNYITNSFSHHCLSLDHGRRSKGYRTDKVLGGNVAIKLDLFEQIVPFYSSTYNVHGGHYLTRGEDTVLAIQMEDCHCCTFYDVDMKIFHNTYSHFPTVPDILTEAHIKDRFFYASMGWIGRNPFLNELKGLNIQKTFRREQDHLVVGAKAIAKYLQDDRFLMLPHAHVEAYKNLKVMHKEFNQLKEAWSDFIRRLK